MLSSEPISTYPLSVEIARFLAPLTSALAVVEAAYAMPATGSIGGSRPVGEGMRSSPVIPPSPGPWQHDWPISGT